MGVLAVHSRPSGPGVYSSSGLAVAVVITDSQQMEWPGQKEGKIVAKGQVETKHPIKSEYVPKSIGDSSRLHAYFSVHFIETSSPPVDELAPLTCLCPCKDGPVSDFNPRPPSDPWRKHATYGQLIIFLASLLAFQQCTGFDSSTSGQKRQYSGADNNGPSKRFRLDNNTDPDNDGASGGENNNNANGGGGSNGNESACNPDGKDSNAKRFACLFYKVDPERYQRCESLKLESWDRVLQHIKRRHVLGPVHCPTCRIHLPGEEEHADQLRNEHIRAGGCEPTSIENSGYLLAGEYDKLKNLGTSGRHDLKWLEAWKRLFPLLPAPLSPFFESQVDMMKG
ncbi:hypothetical protein NM208_g6160 [Fusarium decemcellulare]|uniref:Uncharacterized protein n=1 Tax=Fusarium decemcellulare TaxID=57161 RepID=A0ACC1SE27_9HYPO|nr:hypothetical protein NM208_g6160 [Fusarium decemcellulare]